VDENPTELSRLRIEQRQLLGEIEADRNIKVAMYLPGTRIAKVVELRVSIKKLESRYLA
jgi:hypothetical protein